MAYTSTPPPPPPAAEHGSGSCLASIPSDIIQTLILPRLSGPTLASVACSSSQFLSLSSDEKLWRNVCTSVWPSTRDDRLCDMIAEFRSGHRSFFSDAYAPLSSSCSLQPPMSPTPTTRLISAVDLFYKGEPLFSKVHETETASPWFMSAPFHVDMIDSKGSVPTPIGNSGSKDDTVLKQLEQNLTISWIIIDPVQKRAGSISGYRPASVQRHWMTGDVEVEYSTVLNVDWEGTNWSTELVRSRVTVTFGGDPEKGSMEVKEVSMKMEDLEGRSMNGADSLMILVGAMEAGKRERKERVEDFKEMKNMRRERKLKRERALDTVCVAAGVTIFLLFCIWMISLFCGRNN